MLYYSGHGVDVGGMNLVVPSDFPFDPNWSEQQRAEKFLQNGVSVGELMLPFIKTAGNKYSIGIFDACRRYLPVGAGGLPPKFQEEQRVLASRPLSLVFSNSFNTSSDPAHPKDTLFSYFTYYLVKAFDRTRQRPCDMNDLKSIVSKLMAADPDPSKHEPQFNINTVGQFQFQFYNCKDDDDFVQNLNGGQLNVTKAKLIAEGTGFLDTKIIEEDKGDRKRAIDVAKIVADAKANRDLISLTEKYVSSVTTVINNTLYEDVIRIEVMGLIKKSRRVGDYEIDGNSVKIKWEVDEEDVISFLLGKNTIGQGQIYNRFDQPFKLRFDESDRAALASITPIDELPQKIEFTVNPDDNARLYRPGQKQKIHVVDDDGTLLWTNYSDKVNEKNEALGEAVSLIIESGRAAEVAKLNKVKVAEDGTLIINIKDVLPEPTYKKLKTGGKLLAALPFLVKLIDLVIKVAK